MRWVFFLLVAANLAYFGWVTYLRPAGIVSANTAKLSVDNELSIAGKGVVTLISEVENQKSQLQNETSSLPLTGGGKALLGGFIDPQAIEALKQRLLSFGVDGQVVRMKVDAEKEFWVYLSPLSSRAATLRLLKELQARKLDGFLISQGELANGISLGIFPQEATAVAVQERVKLAGYEAQLKEITRSQDAYWFEVGAAGQRLLDENMLSALLTDFPGLQHRQQ